MFAADPISGPEIAPASGGSPKQCVMFLHGLGADGNDLLSLTPELQPLLPDAHFVSPNAPFPCDMAPMGRQWFSLQSRETAHMLTGLDASRPLLNDYIDETLTRLNLEIKDLFIIGFSQGTMMALHTLLTRATPCAAIVGFSGAIIASKEFATQITTKPSVCLIHGEMDDVVPFAAMPDAQGALVKAGLEVEAHPQPDLGHSINMEGLEAAKAFITNNMK